jgi:LytTr DNA-binding domain
VLTAIVSRTRVWPRPLVIVTAWLAVAIAATCLFTLQIVFTGRAFSVVAVAQALLIIPTWMAITPAVLWFARNLPLTRDTWARRLPLYGALWFSFFVVSNVLIRIPFASMRANFFRDLAAGLSVFMTGSFLAFTVLTAIAHYVERRQGTAPAALHLRDGARSIVVPFDDINWIQSEDNYVLVHADSKSYTARQRMRDVESQLDAARFVRVHRSAIVNVVRVSEVRPLTHGDFEVVLRCGAAVRGTRSRRAALDVMRGRYSATK